MRALTRTELTALRASFACVSWVDEIQRDSCSLGFIGNKTPQLRKRPSMQVLLLFFSQFCSLSDMHQVLKSDSRVVPIGKFNNLSANSVIFTSHKPVLFPRHPFEMASGRSRAFGLKSRSQFLIPISHRLNLLASELTPFRTDRNVFDTQVHAENFVCFLRRFFRNFYCDSKVKFLSPFEQLAIAELYGSGECLPLIISQDKGNLLPTRERRNRGEFQSFQRDGAGKIERQDCLFEDVLFLFIASVRKDNIVFQSATDLRSQAKSLSCLVVSEMMQSDAIEAAMFPRYIGNIVRGIKTFSKRLLKYFYLLFKRIQSAFDRHFYIHIGIITRWSRYVKKILGKRENLEAAFLSTTEVGSFLPILL